MADSMPPSSTPRSVFRGKAQAVIQSVRAFFEHGFSSSRNMYGLRFGQSGAAPRFDSDSHPQGETGKPCPKIRPRVLKQAKKLSKSARSGLETTLRKAEKTAGIFPPLGSVVSELAGFLDSLEEAAALSEKDQGLNESKEAMETLNQFLARAQFIPGDSNEQFALISKFVQEVNFNVGGRDLRSKTLQTFELEKRRRRIEAAFRQLQAEVNLILLKNSTIQFRTSLLRQLSPAEYAKYNSSYSARLVFKQRGHTQTSKMLDELYEWTLGESSAKILMAEVGETTVAYDLCVRLDKEKRLGASFFCSRGAPGCNDYNRIIPTIAYQLARFSRGFESYLCKLLESDPDIRALPVEAQLEAMILDITKDLSHDSTDRTTVVIIDALDLCKDKCGVALTVEAILKHAPYLPFKVLMTSRAQFPSRVDLQRTESVFPRILRVDGQSGYDFLQSSSEAHAIEPSLHAPEGLTDTLQVGVIPTMVPMYLPGYPGEIDEDIASISANHEYLPEMSPFEGTAGLGMSLWGRTLEKSRSRILKKTRADSSLLDGVRKLSAQPPATSCTSASFKLLKQLESFAKSPRDKLSSIGACCKGAPGILNARRVLCNLLLTWGPTSALPIEAFKAASRAQYCWMWPQLSMLLIAFTCALAITNHSRFTSNVQINSLTRHSSLLRGSPNLESPSIYAHTQASAVAQTSKKMSQKGPVTILMAKGELATQPGKPQGLRSASSILELPGTTRTGNVLTTPTGRRPPRTEQKLAQYSSNCTYVERKVHPTGTLRPVTIFLDASRYLYLLATAGACRDEKWVLFNLKGLTQNRLSHTDEGATLAYSKITSINPWNSAPIVLARASHHANAGGLGEQTGSSISPPWQINDTTALTRLLPNIVGNLRLGSELIFTRITSRLIFATCASAKRNSKACRTPAEPTGINRYRTIRLLVMAKDHIPLFAFRMVSGKTGDLLISLHNCWPLLTETSGPSRCSGDGLDINRWDRGTIWIEHSNPKSGPEPYTSTVWLTHPEGDWLKIHDGRHSSHASHIVSANHYYGSTVLSVVGAVRILEVNDGQHSDLGNELRGGIRLQLSRFILDVQTDVLGNDIYHLCATNDCALTIAILKWQNIGTSREDDIQIYHPKRISEQLVHVIHIYAAYSIQEEASRRSIHSFRTARRSPTAYCLLSFELCDGAKEMTKPRSSAPQVVVKQEVNESTTRWIELKARLSETWKALPAVPSIESRNALAAAHGVLPKHVHRWFSDKKKSRVRKGTVIHPEDGYKITPEAVPEAHPSSATLDPTPPLDNPSSPSFLHMSSPPPQTPIDVEGDWPEIVVSGPLFSEEQPVHSSSLEKPRSKFQPSCPPAGIHPSKVDLAIKAEIVDAGSLSDKQARNERKGRRIILRVGSDVETNSSKRPRRQPENAKPPAKAAQPKKKRRAKKALKTEPEEANNSALQGSVMGPAGPMTVFPQAFLGGFGAPYLTCINPAMTFGTGMTPNMPPHSFGSIRFNPYTGEPLFNNMSTQISTFPSQPSQPNQQMFFNGNPDPGFLGQMNSQFPNPSMPGSSMNALGNVPMDQNLFTGNFQGFQFNGAMNMQNPTEPTMSLTDFLNEPLDPTWTHT